MSSISGLHYNLTYLAVLALTTVFQVLTDSESGDELTSPKQATKPATVWKINVLKK